MIQKAQRARSKAIEAQKKTELAIKIDSGCGTERGRRNEIS